MLKHYLLLIIVVSVVRQRVCRPLDWDYNGAYEIAAESIDPHVVAAREGEHLIRRYWGKKKYHKNIVKSVIYCRNLCNEKKNKSEIKCVVYEQLFTGNFRVFQSNLMSKKRLF